MRDQIGRKSLRALVLFGACYSSGRNISSHHAAAFAPSPSCREHSCYASTSTRTKTRHRRHYRQEQDVTLNMVGFKRPRSTDSVASETTSETDHSDQAAKPKISFDLLPDFMQKDPLLVTKQKWLEKSSPHIVEEESPDSERKNNEMMAMTVASIAFSVAVVYALASATPEIIEPNNIKESENAVRGLIQGGNVEKLEFATRNIVGTVLPQSAEDVIAVSIGEGIAGAIGAFATWLLMVVLNFKSDENFVVTPMGGEVQTSGLESTRRFLDTGRMGGQSNVDDLVSEAVADGDYFLTRAAAEPLLEAVGIPIFVASLAATLIAVLPYEAVKITSQKRRSDIKEEILLDMLLEEEENRKKDETVVDKISNSMFAFIQQLNVQRTFDDDIEDVLDVDEELDTMQQEPDSVPALDYIELFADITKWLEYDILITNYRGVLALPNGIMLTTGWESAIFGLLAALSSQLYTDVLYLYSDFGMPLKRERTINRSLEGWASIYATKCVSAATLFGVYEAVRDPTSRLVSQLVSGGVGGCAGSKDFALCTETYLINNPPTATLQAELRAFVVSSMNWADSLSTLLPLNDQETFASFARGAVVSVYSVLDRFFDI